VTEHYDAVGASLLATLKKFHGPLWTPELADTWAQAYGLVAKVMVAAAEQHEDIAPAYWEADVVSVERRSVEVAVIEIAPRQEFPYRAGQSVAVEIPQRPRLWRYFSPANAPQPSGRLQFHIQPIAGGLSCGGSAAEPGRHGQAGCPVDEQLTLPRTGGYRIFSRSPVVPAWRCVPSWSRSTAAGRSPAPGPGASVPRRTNGLEPLRRSLPHPAGQQAVVFTRRWSQRIPPTPAPGACRPWLPTPATGPTGQPWSAARREWSARCRSSGCRLFCRRDPPRAVRLFQGTELDDTVEVR
jgi:hypothetical protein